MCCNSLDEQTILLSLFGNRALYLIYVTRCYLCYDVCMLLTQVGCETCPFSLHRLILLYIAPLGMKCLHYHGNACDVMCCAHSTHPFRKKSIPSRIKIR